MGVVFLLLTTKRTDWEKKKIKAGLLESTL